MYIAFYVILLLAELAVGFCLLELVSSIIGWTFFLAVTALWAILTVQMAVKLKKAADDTARGKIKRNLALVMLIPAVGAVIGLIGFFVTLDMDSW